MKQGECWQRTWASWASLPGTTPAPSPNSRNKLWLCLVSRWHPFPSVGSYPSSEVPRHVPGSGLPECRSFRSEVSCYHLACCLLSPNTVLPLYPEGNQNRHYILHFWNENINTFLSRMMITMEKFFEKPFPFTKHTPYLHLSLPMSILFHSHPPPPKKYFPTFFWVWKKE